MQRQLIIKTQHPDTVQHILWREHLINGALQCYADDQHIALFTAVINYPDDLLSQSMTYWLALAQGCQLITAYEFKAR